jgi:Uma2 family endonuclease
MDPVMEAQILKRRFTVEEFHQMAEAGVFGEDDRLELVDGEVVQTTPIGSPHAACVKGLNRWLAQHLQERALVGIQDPIVLDDQTEMYPDVMVLEPRPDLYRHSHPRGGDVLLVIEVSDTTLDYDRRVKVPRYARAGVPEVWIVDLRGRGIDVYRKPAGERYAEERRVTPGESLAIPRASQHIAVEQILP